jgi:hypothetical protein
MDSVDIAPFSYKRIMVNTADKPPVFQWSIVRVKGTPDPRMPMEPIDAFSNLELQEPPNPKSDSAGSSGPLRTTPEENMKH